MKPTALHPAAPATGGRGRPCPRLAGLAAVAAVATLVLGFEIDLPQPVAGGSLKGADFHSAIHRVDPPFGNNWL